MSDLNAEVKSEGPEWCDLKAMKSHIESGKTLMEAFSLEYPTRAPTDREIGYVTMSLMIFEGMSEEQLGCMDVPVMLKAQTLSEGSEPAEISKYTTLQLAQFLLDRVSRETHT